MASKHQSWADVAVFEDENVGKSLATYLRDKGIEARTYFDKWARILLFLRPPRKTYRVQVRRDQLPAAHNVLSAAAPSVLEEAIHCPSCDSLCVSYPQMTRKFILPTILLHAGILFRMVEHECYCELCHFNWPLSDANRVRVPKPATVHV